MKRYKFNAITSKADMIMGLSYPAVFGFPILAVQLGIFYSGLDEFFKSYPLLIMLMIFAVLYCSYQLVKKIRDSLINVYFVELYDREINIWKNDNKVLSGDVLNCKIHNKPNRMVRAVRVDIYTDNGKISFRTRAKEYKTGTGYTNTNMFGTSDSEDMDTLLSLGEEINRIIGERRKEWVSCHNNDTGK